MTFIASVIARDGVAMVADSFVTTVEHFIDEDTFFDYLKTIKGKKNVAISDIIRLFERKPSHTRNFADKLFQFDKFSAITTAGSAYINKKEVREIVRSIAEDLQSNAAAYEAMSIDDILKSFCDKIRFEVLEHLRDYNMGATDFVLSHFNRIKNIAQVFKIRIKAIDKSKFDPADPSIVTYEDQSHLKIITDGQDSFVDRLIFGSLYTQTIDIKSEFLTYIFKKFKLKAAKKTEIRKEIMEFTFLGELVRSDVFSIKFRELSLQEAVDLAALLIKIIMDIQVYTEKIPTVGGLIRLAVIHKERGFEWISGDKIIPSKII